MKSSELKPGNVFRCVYGEERDVFRAQEHDADAEENWICAEVLRSKSVRSPAGSLTAFPPDITVELVEWDDRLAEATQATGQTDPAAEAVTSGATRNKESD